MLVLSYKQMGSQVWHSFLSTLYECYLRMSLSWLTWRSGRAWDSRRRLEMEHDLLRSSHDIRVRFRGESYSERKDYSERSMDFLMSEVAAEKRHSRFAHRRSMTEKKLKHLQDSCQ